MVVGAQTKLKDLKNKSKDGVDTPSSVAEPSDLDKRIQSFNKGIRVALIVGASKYDPKTGYDSLDFAHENARQLKEILEDAGEYDKIILLSDGGIEPNSVNIQNSLKELAGMNPHFLLFYYSGHGLEVGKKDAIAPNDAMSDDKNTITFDELKRLTANITQRLFLIDACREKERYAAKEAKAEDSAKNIANSKTIETIAATGNRDFTNRIFPNQSRRAAGLMIVTATKSGYKSLEDADLESGVFSYYLLKGLRGGIQRNYEDYVTSDQLFKFTNEKIKSFLNNYYKDMDKLQQMEPNSATENADDAGYFLITTKRPSRKFAPDSKIKSIRTSSGEIFLKQELDRCNPGRVQYLSFYTLDRSNNYQPASLDGISNMQFYYKEKKKEKDKPLTLLDETEETDCQGNELYLAEQYDLPANWYLPVK